MYKCEMAKSPRQTGIPVKPQQRFVELNSHVDRFCLYFNLHVHNESQIRAE